MSNGLFALTKVGKDELANHFDAICDLLEKHYGCEDCPFNNKGLDFECKLDEIIEDVFK